MGGNTIPRITIEESEYEKKRSELEKLKKQAEEDEKWDTFVNKVQEREEPLEIEKKRRRVLPTWMTGGGESCSTPPMKKLRSEPELLP